MEQKEKEWVESEAKKYATPTMLKYGNVDAAFIAGATAYYIRIQKAIDAYADLTVALTQENTELRKEVRDLKETTKGYRDSYDQD